MVANPLLSAAAELRKWVIRSALPLWAGSGFDPAHGWFEERLTLKGQRVRDAPLRLMVQARQIYVYSLAARRDWYPDARTVVDLAFAAMVNDFYRRGGAGGWVHSIWHDGTIADPRRDLYAHAFVLLSIASYVRMTGNRSALALADETLDFLDVSLRAPKGGGYLDGLPARDGLRRQNPHMHLFEALLALWSSSADDRYLAKAGELFDLFTNRFFLPAPGVLCEYFDAELRPAEGLAGRIVEPGHHYEWIWLLRGFARASGRPVEVYVDALFAHADGFGYDQAGLIVDEVLLDGAHYTPSRRVWPLTEAIKANLVEAELGRANSANKAASLTLLLHQRFLTRDPSGGWIDRLGQTGDVATDFMPASTFYHIACAIDELERVADGPAGE